MTAQVRTMPNFDVLKALTDPVRWNIITQVAAVDELACSVLEDTLPVSRPTISYHAKILVSAGLISVRKEGKNIYYTLRREAIGDVFAQLATLAPVAPGPGEPDEDFQEDQMNGPTVLTW